MRITTLKATSRNALSPDDNSDGAVSTTRSGRAGIISPITLSCS